MIKKINKDKLPIIFILILSFILNRANLKIQGYGNEYYAAGIKSMLTSFKNFFFLSFDPSGFVSLNKPPIGLWIQGIFGKIFGVSGFALILPEALAGTLCVFILYILIKRYFGFIAGIMAALILAITPIYVAVSRTNDFQTILILFMLLSIMPAIKAAKTGNIKYLIVSVIIVGIAFNINRLESFIIIPAIYLTYIFSESEGEKRVIERYVCGITFITQEREKVSLKAKIKCLILATIVLLVVSLSWSFLVDLVPVNARPYVGDSTTNSEIELVLNQHNQVSNKINSNINLNYDGDNTLSYNTLNENEFIKNYNEWNTIHKDNKTQFGIFRLFQDNNLSDQIAWFLPLAIISLIVSIINRRKIIALKSTKNIIIMFFSIWFVTEFLYFSFVYSNIYDLATLAVPTAALCGIGIKKMIQSYRKNKSMWLSLSLGLTIIVQYIIVIYYRENLSYLLIHLFYLDLGISIIAVFTLFKIRNKKFTNNNLKNGLIVISIIGCLIIPLIGSSASLVYKTDGIFKGAGLQLFESKTQQNVNNYMKNYGVEFGGSEDLSKFINFLNENKGENQEYLLVTPSASVYAQNIILDTGDKVMALGGRTGNDDIVTLFAFKQLVREGKVKYVLVGNETNSFNNASIMNWVKNVGKVIPNSQWQDTNITVANNILYNVFKNDRRDTLYEVTPNDVS
ncbi:glycosyltransferase family 39 protein [Sarcina ventriculi]|uniref:glycosyltransferase family 39 protein n=1 Tax=Sarcina ventriculi TaxID=1267 RepID=UPI001C1228BE|nr:glycosyltransferase family 39 protein [Sarcina ventriculi]MBU5322333.1 glycosyltransferase family 39 protein [Sarcina ventriculi]